MTEYYLVQNDREPAIKQTLADAIGPIDLSSAQDVKIRVHFPSGVKEYNAVPDPDQPGLGMGGITYNLQIGDVPDAGRHRMQTRVIWVGDLVQTFPNRGYDYLVVTEAI